MDLRVHVRSIACAALFVWPFPDAEARAQAGDDFFAYANRLWLQTAVIPAGRDRWTVRDDIAARTRAQIATILDDTPIVARFRAALMNDAAIEGKGMAPLAPMLDEIAQVRDRRALAEYLGRTMHADASPLDAGTYRSSSVLGFAVEHSIHGERTYTPILVQGGLTLDRDAYLSAYPDATAKRDRYRRYAARILLLAGFDMAPARAERAMALETAIAATQATQEASAVDRNADNEWSVADFAHRAPGLDWAAFFAAAGLGTGRVIVAWQPSAMTGVAYLAAAQPLDAWKDYLRVRLIDGYADELPRALADAAAEFRGDARTREQRARAITELAMADVIGEQYVARYFSPVQQARVQRIVANVAAAFRARVERVPWLSPASRAIACAKLDRLYVGVGYDERRLPVDTVQADADDALGNLRRVRERDRARALARLAMPFDQRAWSIAPQSPGALLNFQQNAYLFAAALLQPPKFDSTASDAAAYGAIGAIIGHDISHFVDVLGADYQPDGSMRRWWTADDSTHFEAAAEPLVQQFSAYEALPGVRVDGRLTRTENVADLAGLVAAFDAHRAALGPASPEAIRARDREFFLAFAQAFGSTMTDAGMRAQLANDHAPERYRMNTVRNLDAWYEAFDVTPGHRLYVAPSARMRVW